MIADNPKAERASRMRGEKCSLCIRDALFSVIQICEFPHIREPDIPDIYIFPGKIKLFLDGGGECSVKLSPDTFSAQCTEVVESGSSLQKILVGTEGGGIFLYIGRDEFQYLGSFCLERSLSK